VHNRELSKFVNQQLLPALRAPQDVPGASWAQCSVGELAATMERTIIASEATFTSEFGNIHAPGRATVNDNRCCFNLRSCLLHRGSIVSSPGCSDPKWDTAPRSELKAISHPVIPTVNAIPRLTDK
jgi:hypothetical protein